MQVLFCIALSFSQSLSLSLCGLASQDPASAEAATAREVAGSAPGPSVKVDAHDLKGGVGPGSGGSAAEGGASNRSAASLSPLHPLYLLRPVSLSPEPSLLNPLSFAGLCRLL